MSQLRGIKEGRKLFPANLLRLRDTRDTNGQIFHSFLGRDNHAIDFYTFLCNFYRNHRSSKLFPQYTSKVITVYTRSKFGQTVEQTRQRFLSKKFFSLKFIRLIRIWPRSETNGYPDRIRVIDDSNL